jgi:hypothetical protein
MLDAVGDNNHLSLLEPLRSVSEVHSKSPIQNEEHLILVLMSMPDEISAELNYLDLLAIQFRNYLR